MATTATNVEAADAKRHSHHEIEHDKIMTEQRIILTEEDVSLTRDSGKAVRWWQ